MVFSSQKTTSDLLLEAAKLPTKYSFILPVLSLSFLASSLLFFSFTCSLNPFLSNVTVDSFSMPSHAPTKALEYTATEAILLKDLKKLLGLEAICVVAAFAVHSVVVIVLTRAVSLVHTSEFLPIKHFVSGLGRSPVITRLYFAGVSFVYVSLLLAIFPLMVLVGEEYSFVFTACGLILLLVGFLVYLCLAMVWLVRVVMAVVDEAGCYRLVAVPKAAEVVRGQRRQGILLMWMDVMIAGAIYAVYKVADGYVSPSSTVAWVAVGLVYLASALVIAAFGCALIFEFYWECQSSICRERRDEEVALGDGSVGSVPASTVTD